MSGRSHALTARFVRRPVLALVVNALVIVAGLAAQLLLLHVAGFSIATGILFAFTARAFGKTNLAMTIPVGIGLSFAVWVIFSQLLMLNLPAGPLEHLIFSGT